MSERRCAYCGSLLATRATNRIDRFAIRAINRLTEEVMGFPALTAVLGLFTIAALAFAFGRTS